MKATRISIVVFLAFAQLAHAQPGVSAASATAAQTAPTTPASLPMTAEEATGQKETTFQLLDHLNTENVLLSAQIEHQKLVNKLAQVQAGKDPDDQQSNHAPVNNMPAPMVTNPQALMMSGTSAPPKGPNVELVSTSPKVNGGQPTATIVLANGRSINAVVGTKLPGVGVVTLVSAQQVLYRDGTGHEASLPFGSDSDGGSR